MTRLDRSSSTPRLLGPSRGASGILDRPVEPGDDTEQGVRSHSRGGFRPGFASVVTLERRGRRERRMLAAPAGLACKEKCTLRTQATTGQPRQSGTPCAMALRLIRDLLGVRACLAAVTCRFVTSGLDPSVGGSGPHDFAVRPDVFVRAQARCTSRRPSHPASHVRDDRDTPLLWRRDGWREP
jgi:hypothetical protein